MNLHILHKKCTLFSLLSLSLFVLWVSRCYQMTLLEPRKLVRGASSKSGLCFCDGRNEVLSVNYRKQYFNIWFVIACVILEHFDDCTFSILRLLRLKKRPMLCPIRYTFSTPSVELQQAQQFMGCPVLLQLHDCFVKYGGAFLLDLVFSQVCGFASLCADSG